MAAYRSALVLAMILAFTATTVAAQDPPRPLGKFRDWTAYTYEDGNGKVCYIVSEPVEARGDYTRRGDTYVMISHWPGRGSWGEVMVVAGYEYQSGSTTTATVGNSTFDMETEGDAAWVVESDQSGLLAAMRRGRDMTIEGTSSRGTLTTDTYSLMGVTAGMEAMEEECPRR